MPWHFFPVHSSMLHPFIFLCVLIAHRRHILIFTKLFIWKPFCATSSHKEIVEQIRELSNNYNTCYGCSVDGWTLNNVERACFHLKCVVGWVDLLGHIIHTARERETMRNVVNFIVLYELIIKADIRYYRRQIAWTFSSRILTLFACYTNLFIFFFSRCFHFISVHVLSSVCREDGIGISTRNSDDTKPCHNTYFDVVDKGNKLRARMLKHTYIHTPRDIEGK